MKHRLTRLALCMCLLSTLTAHGASLLMLSIWQEGGRIPAARLDALPDMLRLLEDAPAN